ncbi:hypothetical protein M407DRAFT_216475 [Tulasnella calospora MUT 4182]|uniref:Uncharacterized protein n=1 Tax=Tulasnella calospora MUT 4182 TaxID=1051891 RepID=A0A0C3QIN7_9AGAM|nr:hypothetical protein M407DRAFT_216475 [Tulasnella calospora MUT 4182]
MSVHIGRDAGRPYAVQSTNRFTDNIGISLGKRAFLNLSRPTLPDAWSRPLFLRNNIDALDRSLNTRSNPDHAVVRFTTAFALHEQAWLCVSRRIKEGHTASPYKVELRSGTVAHSGPFTEASRRGVWWFLAHALEAYTGSNGDINHIQRGPWCPPLRTGGCLEALGEARRLPKKAEVPAIRDVGSHGRRTETRGNPRAAGTKDIAQRCCMRVCQIGGAHLEFGRSLTEERYFQMPHSPGVFRHVNLVGKSFLRSDIEVPEDNGIFATATRKWYYLTPNAAFRIGIYGPKSVICLAS